MTVTEASGAQTRMGSQAKAKIEALLELAESLRQALIKRDIETIWGLLEQQGRMAIEIEEDLRFWQEVSEGSAETPEHQAMRAEIRTLLARLRRAEESNGNLARSLSGAVQRALAECGASLGDRQNIYNRRGVMGPASKSMLVNQTG